LSQTEFWILQLEFQDLTGQIGPVVRLWASVRNTHRADLMFTGHLVWNIMDLLFLPVQFLGMNRCRLLKFLTYIGILYFGVILWVNYLL
jgi:hypothetical protein